MPRVGGSLKIVKPGFWALAAIMVGVGGIIAPILWDRYKLRSAVELRCVSFETLVESSDQLENLAITYNGESLRQISKADFVLINTGRTPILEKDVVSRPEITFPRDTEVLAARVQGQHPENLGASVDLDRARNAVVISFPLLNADDYVRVGVFTNSKNLSFDGKARIAGVAALSVTRRIPSATRVSRNIPLTVYPVGFFAAVLLLAAVKQVIPSAVKQQRMKRSIRENKFAIPESGTPETYLSFVNSELSFTTPGERGALLGMIGSFPAGKLLDSDQQKQVRQAVLAAVRSAASNVVVALILLGVSLWGIWYILAFFW
jgi:hypothetical protein